jgi:hypothetical protein
MVKTYADAVKTLNLRSFGFEFKLAPRPVDVPAPAEHPRGKAVTIFKKCTFQATEHRRHNQQ